MLAIEIPTLSGEVDHDFLATMIPHHQMAIDMANTELAQGRDPYARRLAKQIVDAQTAEIAQMQKMLTTLPPAEREAPADDFPVLMDQMHAAMPAPVDDPDTDFIRSMIPHHQAAVDMARIAVANGHDPEVKKLALNIMGTQNVEIGQMKVWLEHR